MEEMLKEMKEAFEEAKRKMEITLAREDAYCRGRIDAYDEMLKIIKAYGAKSE